VVTLLRRHPVFGVVALVLLAALTVVGASAITVWRAAHNDDASHVDRADVIIVLGAAQYGGTPSPVFQGRLDHAILLYRQRRADSVMVVGSKSPGDTTTEAEAGRDYLVSHGVPAGSVLVEPVGRTTYESLVGASRYMNEHGMRSAFLVSDPWHNARITRMASDLGFQGYASATWTSAATSEETRFTGYARETFAYLYYRVFGR
jgi:vancomycin permeability regulator SanA